MVALCVSMAMLERRKSDCRRLYPRWDYDFQEVNRSDMDGKDYASSTANERGLLPSRLCRFMDSEDRVPIRKRHETKKRLGGTFTFLPSTPELFIKYRLLGAIGTRSH